MRNASIALALVVGAVSHIGAAEPFRMSLDDARVGKVPPGWVAAKTGSGPGCAWAVVEDPSAPGGKALAQTSSEGPNRLFNLCLAEKTSYGNLDLTVSFKAVAGTIDQGGGPVWRCQNSDNYYIARMNPLEDNYRLYKVVAGKRIQLASADVIAAAGRWHTLRIVHQRDHIQCFLNGKLYLDVKDGAFTSAGAIGLWTKADAQTSFVELQARETNNEAK